MIRRRGTDESVGALLRDLPVPEHADDFFDRLGAQLRADGQLTGDASSEVIDLSVRRQSRRTHPATRFVRRATAPAAAVACFALVVGGGQFARQTVAARRERISSRIAATTLRPYVAATTGLRVRFHTTDKKNVRADYTAVISPTGDYHLERATPAYAANFDARTATRTKFEDTAGSRDLLTLTGLPEGAPDGPEPANPTGSGSLTPNGLGVLSRDLGAAVRAISAEGGAVKRVTWHDASGRERPALEHEDAGGAGTYADYQYLKVDEQTGIPVQIEQRKATATIRTVIVDELAEMPLTPALLAPALPTDAVTAPTDRGFVAMTPADAARAVRYQLLLPTWIPTGYYLARVSVAQAVDAVIGQHNPANTEVVSMLYRNDLRSFTVSTRRAGTPPITWSDPLTQTNNLPPAAELARVTKGVLAGLDLHVGISPVLWPHVWAQRGDVAVTIAGDLNRRQLLQVAQSLEAYAG